jgi:ArsR family transcriptional regulator
MVQVNNHSQDAAMSEPGAPPAETTPCCSGIAALLSPEMFKAFADPRRVSLLVQLAEARKPCTVGQLAEGSEVDLSVVSRHLAILRQAGVISCVKQGKEVWCSVRRDELIKALRDLADALEACCPMEAASAE